MATYEDDENEKENATIDAPLKGHKSGDKTPCFVTAKAVNQTTNNAPEEQTTVKATGTDPGIINLRAVATEGGEFAATVNVEGVRIILLAAVPLKIGERTAG